MALSAEIVFKGALGRGESVVDNCWRLVIVVHFVNLKYDSRQLEVDVVED